MRFAKLGLLGALVIGTVVGVLWVTGAVAQDALREGGLAAFLALAILIAAAAAWSLVRRDSPVRDDSDRPVP